MACMSFHTDISADIAALISGAEPLDFERWGRVHDWLADHRLDLLQAFHRVPAPSSVEEYERTIRVFLRVSVEAHGLRVLADGDELEL